MNSTCVGIRRPFETKIDFKKILAKRCTETVSFEIPYTLPKLVCYNSHMKSIIGSKYFALVVVAIVFVAGAFLYINNPDPVEYEGEEEIVCTQDVLLCPDGSYVGREGKDCQFKACPPPPEGTQFEDGTIESGDNNISIPEN